MIEESIRYLESDEAIQSLEADPYWPKWDSPWWHMTLLHEMGLAKRIPERAIRKMMEELGTHYLKTFPIRDEELPEGCDPFRETMCHCALGNIHQTLSAWGADVDGEHPWIRQWFLRYQLPDGGLNCDNEAYLKQTPPSSIVGTISPLEAVLRHTPRAFTPEEILFLDRGAQCLLDRQLMHATSNPHNADEREDEADWLQLSFPRFYFYDILRGLNFVAEWAERLNRPLPSSAIEPALKSLEERFPDHQARIGRQAFSGVFTMRQVDGWNWERRQPASLFPLLKQVSRLGEVSPHLTRQWTETRQCIARLEKCGLLA